MNAKPRLFLPLLAGLVLAIGPRPAEAQFRTVPDDKWCDRDRDGDGNDHDDEKYCEVREAVLPATARVSVDSEPNGGIKVEGWDRGEIRVRAKVTANARTDEAARAMVSDVRIETAPTLHAEGPDTSGRSHWSVSYQISVPRRTGLSLRSHNGGISIADVHGDIDFETTNGGVSLSGLSGQVRGRTTNGGLSVRLAGTEWTGEGLDAQTTNGGITLAVPDGYNAHLEASTVNGGMNIDFPVTVQGNLRRSLSVDLGRGGRPIQVSTTNGGVSVRRKMAMRD
jgi:putative adhesin